MDGRNTRRRDDRPTADSFKPWVSTDKHPPDDDYDRRRQRSATFPAHSYDPRSYPSRDTPHNEPRQPSRPHRQDPHHPSAAAHSSHHHSSAQAPSTSKAYQHATRPSAQYSSSGYHYPQPSSYHTLHATPTYPVASSSRRHHPEPPDPRSSRRPAPPAHQSACDQVSSGEEMARASRHPSRPVHSSTHPPLTASANQEFWNPPKEMSSSRRYKDTHRDRDRDQEWDRDRDREKRERDREREREKEKEKEKEREKLTELENRYKDRARAERHRERATEVRYQESSRSKYHDRRKDSDTEGGLYSEQRNASKASLSGREGYPAPVRESGNSHRRHRTEDGMASTGRRHQPENTQNPITTMPSQSTSVPQPDVQQTGEPPPAPRVMPVYLPPKAKSQRSHREGRPPTAQGAQSGSDTERPTGKHRMERTPSGPAVQRSDGHTLGSTRDRGSHDVPIGPRDDVKKLEGKYGVHQDTRQPLAPINVDIPLVTPGFNASALPTETRTSILPQIVSIRAGQGPSDLHDVHLKSSAISHSDTPQEIVIHPPQSTSASIVKSSSHTRSQSYETRVPSDRPVVVEHSRTEPHGDDLPPGQRMSVHEPSQVLPAPISRASYARGNLDAGPDNPNLSYSRSRPPSRSAQRTPANNIVSPAVVGPRALRSVSQGPQSNEPFARPPSVAQYASTSSVPNQFYVPPSPAHPSNNSPKAGHTRGSLSSAQPSPKTTQLHGMSPSYSRSTQPAPSVPPSIHATPIIVPQTLTPASRPSTRDGTHTDVLYAPQQSVDRQSTTDNRSGLRQTSDSATVQASWVVQTPATAKRDKIISREDKYLGDHRFNPETPHTQLRQVLSQDDDSFPRASLSMMKASQATTPATSSQRNSPGARARDVSFGTPRGTLVGSSPKPRSAKEAPASEHIPRQSLLSHLAGPPQIAVVGATPVTIARDLPHGRVDHTLLAPPLPAPTRASRTTSSSQDQQSQPLQPAVRSTSSTPYQPQLAPEVHAPPLFQSYRPPSLPVPEENGQFSPPPLPIPPPRGLEDSPSPPIETRPIEIIPTRSRSDGHSQTQFHSFPEVQSEIVHMPSQSSAPPQHSSVSPPRATQLWQPSRPDSTTVPTSTLNWSTSASHTDARPSRLLAFQPDDVQVAHQEVIWSVPVHPSQSAPARTRPKVTVEDIPEDSPVSSKAVPTSAPTITPSVPASRPMQSSQHITDNNVNLTSKSMVVDQPGHKSSPQSKNKDPPPHRGTESIAVLAAPPMPPPTSVTVPASIRMSSSAPPTQPTFIPSAQTAPAQRATSHTVSSRTQQRAAEMLQASKLSTSAETNPGGTGSTDKPVFPSAQTTYNPVSTASGQNQPVNGASIHGPSASRLVSTSTTTAPHTSASAIASVTKVAAHMTPIGSGPPVDALGLQIPTPPAGINTQSPSAPDPLWQQSIRPGALSTPSLDATPTTVMSTAAVKNAYQEQLVVDSTRPRDVTPSATRNPPPSSHIYPISARPSTSSAMTQQTHVTPAQPLSHHRIVSLPIAPSSSAVQKPPSPRKYSQPISSTTVSTQPFPSRPSVPESQSARPPISGHVSTAAPFRSARPPPPDRTNDPDMLKTPSSISPSPILNPDSSTTVPQSVAVPIRARQSSTDSKDDKKKPSGLFGLFRARTLSSKAADPPVVSRAPLDREKVHLDASVAPATTTPTPRGVTLTWASKESKSAPPPATPTPARVGLQSKTKGRALDPIAIPPPPLQAPREHKDPTPHIFTPFKFLSMHSKRYRTVSAASLDVCDGNTATNTVVGSPDHSIVSQAQPLPPIIPPGVRDPLVATSEWRDREEAGRRERRTHRIRRPGVTFDVEEEPPSPSPGTAKRKKLIRRPSGRAGTPGPPHG